MNMSKDQFHALYDSLKIAPQEDTIGTVADVVIDPVQGTHVISWKLDANDMWEYAGEEVAIVARYYSSKNPDVYVDVKLTATVEDVADAVALSSAKGDYIKEYWTDNFEATKYNVNVPADKDTIADNCQFENDINASFVTYPKGTANAGKLLVENVDSVAYFFCKDVATITSLTYKNQKHEPILDEDGNFICHPQIDSEHLDSKKIAISDSTRFVGDDHVEYVFDGVEKEAIWAPLRNGMRLYVTAPVSEIDSGWKGMIENVFLASLMILTVCAAVVLDYSKSITQPLHDLTVAAKQVQNGNYESPLEYDGNDEVGVLTRTFKQLTAHTKANLFLRRTLF